MIFLFSFQYAVSKIIFNIVLFDISKIFTKWCFVNFAQKNMRRNMLEEWNVVDNEKKPCVSI